MSRTLAFVLICAVVLTSACSEPSANPALLSESWAVKLNISGGIVGFSRSVEASSNGDYKVVNDDQSFSGKLTEAELTELDRLVNGAVSASNSNAGMSACADCIVYDIGIDFGGATHNLSVDEFQLQDSGLESLVAFLRELMERG